MLRKYFEVYYDLIKERRDRGLEDKIAIHTIEQISPFPFDIMKQVTDEYSNAELFWVQEVSWTCIVSRKYICGRIKKYLGAQEHGGVVVRPAQDTNCCRRIPQVSC